MKRLLRLVTHNWFEKLFALLLAFLLWITLAGETVSEIGIEVPLEYRNIPPQMEITGDATNTVEVRLRGSSNLLRQITAEDISTTIEVSKLESGDHIIPLTPRNVQAPFGIEVLRVNPSRVRIHFEKTVSKRVTVVPRIQGVPGSGYEIRQILISPASVELVGPASRVTALESISTEPVNVEGKAADVQTAVDLDITDPLVRLQQTTTVQVRVEIRPK